MQFTDLESTILNCVQKGMRLSHDLFDDLAQQVGSAPDVVISLIKLMKEKGIIRNISGIFNASALGYSSSLVALNIPEETLEKAAAIINDHPGVSHNYLRDNEFNVWFTLSIPEGIEFAKTVEMIAQRCDARDSLILHTEKLYKIGLMLHVGGKNSVKQDYISNHKNTDKKISLTDKEREAVMLLQVDMPLAKYPFEVLIRNHQTELSENELISIGNEFKDRGIMRRYSAVLRHHSVGYSANAMTVWRPESQKQLNIAVKRFKQEPSISHLYLRTIYPGKWEYPLFAMIHAQSDNELKNIIAALAHESGMQDFKVLRSLREYKKKRVQYYSDEFNEWNKRNMA